MVYQCSCNIGYKTGHGFWILSPSQIMNQQVRIRGKKIIIKISLEVLQPLKEEKCFLCSRKKKKSPGLQQRKGGETSLYHCFSRPLPQVEVSCFNNPCSCHYRQDLMSAEHFKTKLLLISWTRAELEKDKMGDWNTWDCRYGLWKSICYSIVPCPIKHVSPHQHFLGFAAVLCNCISMYKAPFSLASAVLQSSDILIPVFT